jgi:hypothetical protein
MFGAVLNECPNPCSYNQLHQPRVSLCGFYKGLKEFESNGRFGILRRENQGSGSVLTHLGFSSCGSRIDVWNCETTQAETGTTVLAQTRVLVAILGFAEGGLVAKGKLNVCLKASALMLWRLRQG